MNLAELMQNDEITQFTILKLTQSLKPGEYLFSYRFFGAICFKKVRNKRRFRFWYRWFEPVYLTKYALKTCDQVILLGILIKN